MTEIAPPASRPASPERPERRSALRVLGGALLTLLGGTLLGPAALYLLDPLRRRRVAAPPSLPVAPLAEVPDLAASGAPLRAVVVAESLRDAWSRQDRVPLGAVWLCRRGEAVTALSTICPHAGCAVDFDDERRLFVCPCHKSSFELDGRRRDGPSPRDMDRLDVEIEGGVVRCRFQRFRPARGRKEPV